MVRITQKQLSKKEDERGWLCEIMKAEDVYNDKFGQMFVTTAKPGQTKGNHWHTRKKEWFCVIQGRGLLTIEDNNTGEIEQIEMGENNMVLVEIPLNCNHKIENIGSKEMVLLAYTNEVFNPEDTDTFCK